MSNKGKFLDYTPFIRTAGVTTALEGVTADNSVRQDLYFKPRTSTPDEIKKYRRSTREVPGVRQLHRGVYNDPKDYEQLVHGVKTEESSHVNDCIKGSNLSGINFFVNDIHEKKYERSKREPLGKSIMRNYEFPEEVKSDGFQFGIPTTGFYNAKEVIYSGTALEEPDNVKKMYTKTHGLTDPGEQKDRNYNWYVDKNTHIFGKPQEIEVDGTKKSLRTDFNEAQYPKTTIVGKRLEDFRQATEDMVGRSKFKGTLHPSIDENHVFGKKSVLGGTWNAGKCIHGDPEEKSEKHFEPDPDLGKSVLYRSKLENRKPIEAESNRTFGVPSIRRDLVRSKVSICDINNYGNEKDAFDLLYPNPCAIRGVDDEDFEEVVNKDELRDLLNKNNYKFPDEEYNLIYQIALKNYPNPEEKVSFKAFLAVMRNLKREYMKYRTLIK